jgi:hypothetical protein
MPTYVKRARKSLAPRYITEKELKNTAQRVMRAMPVDPYGFLVYARGNDRHNVYASPNMRHRAEQLFIKAYPAQKDYASAYSIGLDSSYYTTTDDGRVFKPTPEFPDRKTDVGMWQSRNSVENSGRKFKIWAKAYDLGRKDGAAIKVMHLAFRQTGKFPPVKVSSVLSQGKTLTASDIQEVDLVASIEALFHADGSTYFSAGAFDYARDEAMPLKSRVTLILMSPDDFLRMAKTLSKPSEAKTAHVASANGNFRDLPRLIFENNGDGTAHVIGHEGRHRMYFLKDKGVKRVPVMFVSQPGAGPAIRWGAATGFDTVDPWPTVLFGQENNNTMSFPVSEVYPRSTQKSVTAFDMTHIKAGQPFEYMHNPKSSRSFKTNQYFGQNIEPAGRYLTYIAPKEEGRLPEGWQQGLFKFEKPLSVPWGSTGDYAHPDNWKKKLSEAFGGKTGKRLSQAVRDKGFDGIVTYDKYGPSEIVDLTMYTPKKKRALTAQEYDYSEYGYWITDAGDLITVPQERHANVARNWIEKNNPRAADALRDTEGHLNASKAFDFVQTQWGWIRLQNHGLECNIAIVQNTVSRLAYKTLRKYVEESPFHIFVVDTSGEGYLHKTFIGPKDTLSFVYKYMKRDLTALIEAAELEIKASKKIKIHRGEYTGNKGGVFWTEDKEFARNFTQSGQDKEIRTRYIEPSAIDESAATTFAGDEGGVTKALAHAKKNGFKALRLNEGENEPLSLYVFDKSALSLTATDRVQHYGKSLYDQGKHDFLVIYRAVPKTVTEFKPGDYVTLSKKFAIEHAEHVHAMGDAAHVIKIVVDPHKVYDAMNPGEYFYGGEAKRGKVFYTAGQDLEAAEKPYGYWITPDGKLLTVANDEIGHYGVFKKYAQRTGMERTPEVMEYIKSAHYWWILKQGWIRIAVEGYNRVSLEIAKNAVSESAYQRCIKLLNALNGNEYLVDIDLDEKNIDYNETESKANALHYIKRNIKSVEGDDTMRADLLASLQERMTILQADAEQSYTNKTKSVKLLYYANRSTPQTCKPGQTVKAKAGYGKRVKIKTATPEQVKQLKAGKWVRDRHDGKKPNEAGAKKSSYRPWLHASIERRLEAAGLI